MKTTFATLALAASLMLVGAGCGRPSDGAPVPPERPQAAKELPGTFSILGARFRAADPGWTVIQEDGTHVAIVVSESPDLIRLVGEATAPATFRPDELMLNRDGIAVGEGPCESGPGCYMVVTPQGSFDLRWSVESPQVPPEDADGSQAPDVDVTPEDVRAIMLTAEPAP